jgi:superfamily II DNA or RNA helicase
MTHPILRPYQTELVTNVRSVLAKKRNAHILIQSPTGSGKTMVFSYIAKHGTDKKNKVFILSNRTELLRQTSGAISRFGINHAFINPSVKYPSMDAPCHIAMSQTLQRRYKKEDWRSLLSEQDIIIIDECHLQDFNYILEDGIFDDKTVLAFTATPIRSGSQRQLGIDFEYLINGPSVKSLVEQGFLMPDRYFSVDSPDVKGIPYNYATGDFQSKAMYNIFNSKEKYQGAVHNYRQLTDKTKALTFCVNQLHAIKTAKEFNDAGIPSMYLISGIAKPKKPDVWKNDTQREQYEDEMETWTFSQQYKYLTGNRVDLIEAYRKNKFLNLVNASILTTGFDMPDIQTLIIDRSTASLQLYLQMLGRGSRPSPETGKIYFNVLDFGNHAIREINPFGRYMDDRDWSLWHEPSQGGGIPPTKECPPGKLDFRGHKGCGRLIPISYSDCPLCNFHFETKKEAKEVELKELIYTSTSTDEKLVIGNMNYKQLAAYRELKKYHMNWMARVLFYRGGEDELKKGLRELGYGWGFIYRLVNELKKW